MTLNREIFYEDPTTKPLPNDGVTKVLHPKTPEEWEVLRYELTNFVCEGEYERGLDRILSQYLLHLHEPTQPAAWVSGFYGSGKSHLVRVLEYLWRDVVFPDGGTARGITDLPEAINDHLKELTTAGKRTGGLWSTAGTLGAGSGNSVRLAFLAIVFEGAGLPRRYPQAKFVIWLRREGFLDAVRSAVDAAGKDFFQELQNLYVSPVIAKALLAAYPDFADDEKTTRALLKTQFPNIDDVGTDEVMETLREVLELVSDTEGKIPCSLIVLDELHQFIHDDQSRLTDVQEIVEGCSTRFGSNVLVVGTGQMALGATAQLSKLQDRFTVAVELGDADVERVVREIILRKKPDRVGELESTLSRVSGEIDRHLVGTKIGAAPADKDDLIPDYPILPVRRRFWERVLRAIDRAGFTGQLRTQLRTALEAVKAVAPEQLGTVVSADFIYDQQTGAMLKSGVLLREIEETIKSLDDGTADGALKSRLCRLMFLISQLPTEAGVDTGIRATADTLVDLLVNDLDAGSDALRQRIPKLLDELADGGTVMRVGEEFGLQTREGSEWEGAYRTRLQQALSDGSKTVSDRDAALRAAVSEQLKGILLQQGESRTPRKIEIHFSDGPPATSGTAIPIWVRNEWSISSSAVQKEAAAAGVESPIVFVSLPKRDAEALKQALAKYSAAQETINTRPVPTTNEGQEALRSMESRVKAEKAKLDGLIKGIVDAVRVFQGGGNEIAGTTLRAAVEQAASNSLVRLFREFDIADHKGWGTVVKRVGEGSGDALAAIDHKADADKHPACAKVLDFVPGSGKKGQEIRRHFDDPPYGWPRDAIDGALLALVASGHLRAEQAGKAVKAREITQNRIGVTDFYRETVTVKASQRIAVRKLLTEAGVNYEQGEEALAIPALLQSLIDLAAGAGGVAPLPAAPDTTQIEELQRTRGNEQFVAVYEAREILSKSLEQWRRLREEARSRGLRWETLTRLVAHAETLTEAAEITGEMEAILEQRGLLKEPDPLPPLTDKLTEVLRSALQEAHSELKKVHAASTKALEAAPEWGQIDEANRGRILAEQQLTAPASLEAGTPELLLTTLDRRSLADWLGRAAALPERVARARLQASRLLEPKSQKLVFPTGTLKTKDDVEKYVEKLREILLDRIDDGPLII